MLAKVLREPPTAVGLDTNLWDGKTLSAFIERRWKDRAVGQWLSPWVFHVNRYNPLAASTFRARFKIAAKSAGYPNLTPHDMRR